MNSEEYINFLKTVDKLPREYYSIIREGILQINGGKKELLEVIVELKNKIDKALSWTNRIIEIIKQQPSEDDTWILENLHSIKCLLQGSDKECNLYPKTLKCQYPNNIDYFDIFNEDIKSIVTKEAFENMEYKIGDK